MPPTECITRKWGNSLGVIIPKEIVEEQRIKENQRISIEIKKKHRAKEFFGLLPEWKKSTPEIKQGMKEGWG